MSTLVTHTDYGDYVEVLTTFTDPETGDVVAETRAINWKPGTPEHDEPLNRDALADLLHTTLARISVRDDLDPDVRDAFLLIHRFLHADYTDAVV